MKTLTRLAAIILLLSPSFAAQNATGTAAPQTSAAAQKPPRALIVVAHPDDESCFSATVYEITHNLHGVVDQMVITNGEGGYRYSLLAEPYYNARLTEEAVGRAKLPEIRKQELMESGRVLGISNHYFLDQRDVRYTQDINEVLQQHWDSASVQRQLSRRLAAGDYDFVFALFPTKDTHGGHKAATITAFRAIKAMTGKRPVLLGCQGMESGMDAAKKLDWSGLSEPAFATPALMPAYQVDRTVKFGFRNALDYQIIANWVIAAHKSQGAFQMAMGKQTTEDFAILDTGDASAERQAADALFRELAATAVPRE